MPNVMFKRGTQAALNTLINGTGDRFVNGSFYLTSDTNRLYVAQSASNLVELNKSITVVPNVSSLPQSDVEVGQFYYISGTNTHTDTANGGNNGNILAVVTAVTNGVPQWTQVNPDTNTDTGFEYFEKGNNTGMEVNNNGLGTLDQVNHRIHYTITLHPKQTGVNGSQSTTTLNDITADFYVSANDIGTLTTATDIVVSSTAVANNKTTVSVLDNNNANTGGSFTLAGGSNVSLSGGNGSDITISATGYSLSSPADNSDAKVTLTPSVGSTQNVYFTAGTDLVVDGSTAGEIEYSHATYNAPTAATGTAETFSSGNTHTFNVVDGITTSNGHVTTVTKKNITVKDTTYSAGSVSYDSSTNSLEFTITDSNSQSTTGSGSNLLYHDITIDGTTVTKYNQESLGSFYSASEIDNKINSLNAMTYKGTVGNMVTDSADVAALPTLGGNSTIQVGDTYLVVTDGSYGGHSDAKVGDLLIATGTETNGAITSNLTWTLVKAGDRDTTYQYQVVSVSNVPTIQYKPSTSQSWSTLTEITGGTDLTATVNNGNIIINHDASGASAGQYGVSASATPAAGTGKIKVPNVTIDAQGHVTAISDQEITLPADNNTTYSLSAEDVSGDAAITLTPSSGSATHAYVVGDGIITASVPTSSSDPDYGSLKIGHGNSGATAGSYGLAADATPAAGSGSFNIPYVTVDAKGHITNIANHTITLPADVVYTYSLDDVGVSVSTSNNVTTATSTFTLVNNETNGTSQTTLDIKSSSLAISSSSTQSVSANDIQIELEWGSF